MGLSSIFEMDLDKLAVCIYNKKRLAMANLFLKYQLEDAN